MFHSFRNLFITNILDKNISPHMVAPIVGHQTNLGITGKVYWNKRDATMRQPTVDAFALPGDICGLIPAIEDIAFVVARGRKPGTSKTTTEG